MLRSITTGSLALRLAAIVLVVFSILEVSAAPIKNVPRTFDGSEKKIILGSNLLDNDIAKGVFRNMIKEIKGRADNRGKVVNAWYIPTPNTEENHARFMSQHNAKARSLKSQYGLTEVHNISPADYLQGDALKKELISKFGKGNSGLPKVDVIFVPGGDPTKFITRYLGGNNGPNQVVELIRDLVKTGYTTDEKHKSIYVAASAGGIVSGKEHPNSNGVVREGLDLLPNRMIFYPHLDARGRTYQSCSQKAGRENGFITLRDSTDNAPQVAVFIDHNVYTTGIDKQEDRKRGTEYRKANPPQQADRVAIRPHGGNRRNGGALRGFLPENPGRAALGAAAVCAGLLCAAAQAGLV